MPPLIWKTFPCHPNFSFLFFSHPHISLFKVEICLFQRIARIFFSEQHEQYVQFAREQIERQHQDDGVELSYLS